MIVKSLEVAESDNHIFLKMMVRAYHVDIAIILNRDLHTVYEQPLQQCPKCLLHQQFSRMVGTR